MANNRVTFGSKLGVVLATVGCAVGLGSVWRFPYMLGANGGAAFLLVYILFMIFLGIPVMITEFFIGRIPAAIRWVLSRKWLPVQNGAGLGTTVSWPHF